MEIFKGETISVVKEIRNRGRTSINRISEKTELKRDVIIPILIILEKLGMIEYQNKDYVKIKENFTVPIFEEIKNVCDLYVKRNNN